MGVKSLKKREHQLSNTAQQLEILNSGIFAAGGELPKFEDKLKIPVSD